MNASPCVTPLQDLAPGRWPERIETGDLLSEVEGLHHNPDDFEEGDLIDRLWVYDHYQLCAMNLVDLDGEEWNWDEDTVREYADLDSPFPPIVFDPTNQSIIDGTHRVNAAILRGETQIWAYVGVRG